jgi:hypothetical protein
MSDGNPPDLESSEGSSLNRDEAELVFRKLQVTPQFGRDYVAGFVWVDGHPAVPLHYSNGNFEMSERVAFRFRQALRLTLEEFRALVDCHISRESYCSLVRPRLGDVFH